MKYFNLYPNCYFVPGIKNAAIYDILQKRIFWVKDEISIEFLKQSRTGFNISQISEHLKVDEKTLLDYAVFLQKVDLGGIYDTPKAGVKFRPFMHQYAEDKNGYYRPLETVTLEMSSECSGNCRFCNSQNRLSSLECACGIYSQTKRVEYDIEQTLIRLAYTKPAIVELMGGDPYCNKEDLEIALNCASKIALPVKVKTTGYLMEKGDIAALKKYGASLCLILSNFNDFAKTSFLSNILDWSASCDFNDISVMLLYDETNIDNSVEASQQLNEHCIKIDGVIGYFPLEICNYSESQQFEHFKSFIRTNHTDFSLDINSFARSQKGHPCWKDRLCIMADGEVRPCIGAPNISFGNVNQKHILDIVREDRPYTIINNRVTQNNECSLCEFSPGCFTCSVITEKIRGSSNAKAWNCFYQPKEGFFKNT